MALTKEDLENVAVVVAKTVIESIRNQPLRSPAELQTETMTRLRGLDHAPFSLHHSAFEASIQDPASGAAIRVSGKATFQQKRTALPGPEGGGKGPLTWVCVEIPEDDFADEDGDLRKAHDGEFSEKNRDDITLAPTNPEVGADLRSRHMRSWRIACFNRGRRPLHNLLLGKSAEQVALHVKLADPPPALDAETPPPEVVHVPAATANDPLRAILHAG